MAIFKSGNPALSKDTFAHLDTFVAEDNVMTLQGTVNKTGILLAIVIAVAAIGWQTVLSNVGIFSTLVWGGAIGGFITAMVIIFKKQWAPFLAPIYAALEGLFLGGISAVMNAAYEGIVFQAVTLTFSIFAVLLLIYKFRIIKATENFKLIVAAATGGIAIFYLASILMSFFGVQMFHHGNSTFSIIFSIGVVIVASLNLVVDFDFIEQGAENRAPKYMEWYGAFSLMVTLIWLYIEILRLLSKLRSR